jgi:thiamine biosynthesis protein ThiC
MLLQMIPAYLVVIVYKSKSRDNNKLANVGQDPKTNVNANLKKSSSL